MIRLSTLSLTLLVAVTACGGSKDSAPVPPTTHATQEGGVALSYVEQGKGDPVVFVHGALADGRFWEPQRSAIAANYHFIAPTLRYFGTAPWPDSGGNFSIATQTADVIQFIQQLNMGPVHLVGLSSGGVVALLTASQHPELVRTLTLAEPVVMSLLGEVPADKPALDAIGAGFGKAAALIQKGDTVGATKTFMEWVINEGDGTFDSQPILVKQMMLDNARTLPLMLGAPQPPPLLCANLSAMKTPSLVIEGEHSIPQFVMIDALVVKCISGARLVKIPSASHLMSSQNPVAFNNALLAFLAEKR